MEAAAVGQEGRARSEEDTHSPHTYDAVVIGMRWRMLTYAGVCRRGLGRAVCLCIRMLTFAGVCWRMLTFADVR